MINAKCKTRTLIGNTPGVPDWMGKRRGKVGLDTCRASASKLLKTIPQYRYLVNFSREVF